MSNYGCEGKAPGWWFGPIASIQHCLRIISRVYTDVPQVMTTGIFDGATREAVAAFQREFGLEPTGRVDFATWERLLLVYKNLEAVCVGPGCYNLGVPQGEIVVLRPGDGACCQLEILQAVLNNFAALYTNMPAVGRTDSYDEATAAAVSNFQRLARLPQLGLLDRRTWNTMLAAYNNCITS